MRLTAILILAGCLHAGAKGFSQTVTLSVSNMPLEKVCDEIEQQTGYYFVYAKNGSGTIHLVSLHVKNAPIDEALRNVFSGLPFTYQVIGKVVVVNTINQAPAAEEDAILRDTVEVTGRIVNKQIEPLVNASVVSLKTRKATQTDEKGQFTLKGLPPDDELTVSYIGYKTQKVKTGNHARITVVMDVTTDDLDKMVVQAYGTTSRRFTTSNIGVVTGDDIRKQPTMNPLLALEGKVAGLVITPQTGNESGPIKVEIRGRNAVNYNFTSDPLYIIDGVPLTVLEVGGTKLTPYSSNAIGYGFDQTHMSPTGGQNPLFSLNPADIESVEVLKDADATAIYGSRGAAGVILITTRKGRPGKNHLDLDVAQGMNYVTRSWDMLNTHQYLEMRREAFQNDGITPSTSPGAGYAPDLLIWDTTHYTNWQKFLWGGTGKWTNAQAGYSGGTAQTTFRIGAGYNRSTDLTSVSGANQRASLSFSLNNSSINQRFKLGLSVNYSYSDVNMIEMPGQPTLPPDAPPVFDAKGNLNYAAWDAAKVSYPFAGLLWPYESKTSFLTSNLNFNYTLLKGLVARMSLGYNNTQTNQTAFEPIASADPEATIKPTGFASFGSTQAHNWIAEPQLEYSGQMGRGVLNALAGATVQANVTDAMTVNGRGYTDDALLHSITNAPTITATDSYGKYQYAGVFARVGYRWANKYILNLNGRRDGSSRFGPGKQFGDFGSAGAAWILSEESWLQSVLPKAISFVKLRGSYGITGSDAVGDYQYLSQWGNSTTPPLSSYNGVSTLSPQIQPNPDFHWQVNKKLEGALDLSFLNDRINLEAAYYRDRCNNQLIAFPTASFTGFTSVTANEPADVQNTGWEFQASAKIIERKNFSWTADFNLGINRNKLLAYPDLAQSPYYTIYKVGQSLDNVYMFHYAGINPLNGQYTYTDWNHDGKITADESVPKGTGDDDRYVGVNLAPKFSGGQGNHLSYKNWQLSLYFMFKDQKGNNALAASTPGAMANASLWQYNHRWQHPGDISEAPRLTTTPAISDYNFTSSTGNWTDASFIRLRTVALSYMFPDKWVKKAGMTGMALMVSAQNLFVLTHYQGLDPEVNTFGDLPPSRTITAGIRCNF